MSSRLTYSARRVVDQGGLHEALRLGYNYVGTEHLLLAFLKEDEEGGAREVLGRLGVDRRAIFRTLSDMLDEAAPRRLPPPLYRTDRPKEDPVTLGRLELAVAIAKYSYQMYRWLRAEQKYRQKQQPVQ